MSAAASIAGALRLACICLMVGLSTGCSGTTQTKERLGVWVCWICGGTVVEVETESTGETQ